MCFGMKKEPVQKMIDEALKPIKKNIGLQDGAINLYADKYHELEILVADLMAAVFPEPVPDGVDPGVLNHVERYGVPHPSLEGVGFTRWRIVWLPGPTKWLVATGDVNDDGGLILAGVPEYWMDPLEVGQTFWGFEVGLKAGSGSDGGSVKVLIGDDDYHYYFLHDNADDHNTLEEVGDVV